MMTSIAPAVALLFVLGCAPFAAAAAGPIALQVLEDDKLGADGLEGVFALAMSAGSEFVYTTSFSGDGVAVWSRDAVTGKLALVEVKRDGLGGVAVDAIDGAQALTLSPDGVHVYVAARTAVAVFARDPIIGTLTYIDRVPAGVTGDLVDPKGIAVSPDGAHVYVAAENSDTVTVFTRALPAGTLTAVQVLEDGEAGVDGINDPIALTVSPDGLNVYVAGRGDDAIAVFARDPGTGFLTFVEMHEHGVAGVDGLSGATAVTLSPDGANVYAVGEADAGIAVFDRTPVTGTLAYVGTAVGSSPEAGTFLRGLGAIVVGDGGTRVAVTTRRNYVSILARDVGTGALTFIGGDDLEDALGVVMSPDGQFLYAGTRGERLGVFRLTTLACTAAPKAPCTGPTQTGHGTLRIKDQLADVTDKLEWKWRRGPSTLLAAFGDPVGTTNDLVLCLYDQSAAPQPILESILPAGSACETKPCWKAQSTRGFRYRDRGAGPGGVISALLRAGAAGEARITAKLKGPLLPIPNLPMASPAVMQLQSASGTCWQNVFSTPQANGSFEYRSND